MTRAFEPVGDDAGPLTPKREVQAMALAMGIELSDERLERWADAGIAPWSRSIPGSPERGFTANEVEHILAIVAIVKRLHSERPRKSEIAFWLAYEGRPVPSSLVLEHLEFAVESFLGRFWGLLDSRGGRRADRADALMSPISRAIARMRAFLSGDGLVRQVLDLGAYLVLRALFSGTRQQQLSVVRRFIGFFRPTEPSEEDLHVVWSAASDFSRLLDRDETRNPMKIAVREVSRSDDPDLALRMAEGVRRLIEASGSIIPWLLNPRTLKERFKVSEEDCALVERFLAPVSCAAILTMRDDAETKRHMAELLAGNAESVVADFTLVKSVGEHIANRSGA